MTGHKDNIHCLLFDNTGRFLISAGADKRILVWDISSGHLVADLFGQHSDSIFSLSINRNAPDGVILASGGLDNRVVLWDLQALLDDLEIDELTPNSLPTVRYVRTLFLSIHRF